MLSSAGICPTIILTLSPGNIVTIIVSGVISSLSRYEQTEGEGTSQLVISPVRESDSGVYQCWGLSQTSETHTKTTVRVLVETRAGQCGPGQFHCSTADTNVSRPVCIAARYIDQSNQKPAGY